MANIFYLGRTIYRVTFNHKGKEYEAVVYATYPNKHNKSTVSLFDITSQRWINSKTFYSSVAGVCIEDWVLRHFNPDSNPKLEIIKCDE